MKKHTILVYLAMFTFVFIVFTGCSKATTSKNQTNFYSTDEKGAKTYLKADDKEVTAVTKLAEDFSRKITDRDYTNIDGKVEYSLYTKEYTDQLVKAGDEQATVKTYKDYQIKSKYDGNQVTSVAFSQNFTQAEFVGVVKAHVSDATDDYFKAISSSIKDGGTLAKNAVFARNYKLVLKKEDGNWKVAGFQPDRQITLVK